MINKTFASDRPLFDKNYINSIIKNKIPKQVAANLINYINQTFYEKIIPNLLF